MTWLDPTQYNPKDVCSLCLNKFGVKKAVYKTQCNHVFHNNCLDDYCEHHYGNIKCPICRKTISDCERFWAFRNKTLREQVFNGNQHVISIYNASDSASVSASDSTSYRTTKSRRTRPKRKGRTARARMRARPVVKSITPKVPTSMPISITYLPRDTY